MASKNVISAGHPLSVAAGEEVIWLGGNAFDAAVAAVFASMIAEPTLTSAGGGGYLMAFPSQAKPVVYDFFVDMPRGKADRKKDFYPVQIDFGTTVQEFHIGMASVGVPGNPAGLLEVQKTLGRLNLKDVLAPAIRIAREGVYLNTKQAYLIQILSPILRQTEEGKEVYSTAQLPEGDEIKIAMPQFSDFLESLSEEGSKFFYQGEIADRVVELSRSRGGLIEKEDLLSYQVQIRKPLRCEFAGFEVFLNPPPAQSGWLIKTTLEILQKDRCGKGKKISLLDFILATDLTNQIRNQLHSEFVSDHSFRVPLENYSLEEFQAKRVSGGSTSLPGSRGCTTHVSVLDSKGNGVSVTTSNGEGSGFFIPKTGIMLNNMLGEEDINPKGFHLYPPGTRLPSMMSPTVVLKNGIPALITGTAGSNRIRSAIIQLLIHHLCRGVEIQTATELPRLHLEASTIEAEPGIRGKEIEELKQIYRIQQWQEKNLFFGGVNSVTPHSGGADSRRGGACKVLDAED